MINTFGFLGWSIAAPLAGLIAIFALFIFIFEIWMFVNVIQNRRISDTARVLWAVGIIAIHPFIAIAYYFTDYQKSKA